MGVKGVSASRRAMIDFVRMGVKENFAVAPIAVIDFVRWE
jgi:hypothetical protein